MSPIEVLTLIGGLIGGLALFLYGMSVMSGGLTQASGGKLESLLAGVTKNKFSSWLFGVGVTALVQSSSASTVMVVGLVNSGIMKLEQAVNIILGANLGTTFTAWLLSLNAISSDSILLTLFKPATFTPYLALVGVAILMFSKSDRRKNIASILIGFSVLMFGMQMMSNSVAPLKDSPSFIEFLTSFSNPIVGFVVGIVFTMIIQSSAGTIGVLQALSLSITVTWGMAIPVVVGAEVGTCITAILSSLSAGKNGKRAALMHLYFNVIKAGTFMVLFYTLNLFLHFSFLSKSAGMVGIAAIHTLINFVASPLMLPFSDVLVRMAMKTIPEDARERQEAESRSALAVLDPLFLSNPPFALEKALGCTRDMAEYTRIITEKAMGLITDFRADTAQEVVDLESLIDTYEDQIGTYLVRINNGKLSRREVQLLSVMQRCINDLERLSDHALNITETSKSMADRNLSFSAEAVQELDVFRSAVNEITRITVQAFKTGDLRLARMVEPLEEVIDSLNIEVKRRHSVRLQRGDCTIDLGFSLTDICTSLERISDHCSNIAVDLLLAETDEFDAHGYLDYIKKEEGPEFNNHVEEFLAKYSLPPMVQPEVPVPAAPGTDSEAPAMPQEPAENRLFAESSSDTGLPANTGLSVNAGLPADTMPAADVRLAADAGPAAPAEPAGTALPIQSVILPVPAAPAEPAEPAEPAPSVGPDGLASWETGILPQEKEKDKAKDKEKDKEKKKEKEKLEDKLKKKKSKKKDKKNK